MSHPEEPRVGPRTGAHDAYSALFDELREEHPQRCGLDHQEFESAMGHPATVTARHRLLDGSEVEVPQLVPIEVFEWLNVDYYRRAFPAEFAAGTILHLTDIPEVQIGREAADRLTELADAGGVVVLDGPVAGRWGPRAALERLAGALHRVHLGEPQLLGTQTYWAGPLTSEVVEADPTPISLGDAALLLPESSDPPGRATGAELRLHLSDAEVEAMYELYAAAYSLLNDHPCAQGVDPEEFRDMMVGREHVERLVFQRDGTVESICLVTPDLSPLTWINLEFYRRRFGDELDSGRVHWYPGIATDPGATGARNAAELVELLGRLYAASRNPVVILFDTPDLNSAFLPAYLEELINGSTDFRVRFEVIGAHEYLAVRLTR